MPFYLRLSYLNAYVQKFSCACASKIPMRLLIITDGLMVQVTMETMGELRRSLRDMKDFTVTCGKLHPAERQEYVHIQWQDEEPHFNKGLGKI